MANEIKLKRGAGSDPGASDLVVGEIAIRTDTGKLFTKKDDNSVAEISGGGITDGDKGDITVSSSGATFTIDNDAVTFAKVQNISTARMLGNVSGSTGDIQQLSAANVRTFINVEDGATADQSASDILSLLSDQNIATTGSLTIGTDIIHSGDTDTKISFTTDQVAVNTAGTSRLTVSDSAIQHSLNTTVAGTFTMSHTNGNFAVNNAAGSDVFTVNSASGNVTTSGTVDGRDVAADGTKLDGIESGATADQTKSDIDALGIAASTATTLATARTIAGVSFDGSANISLNNNAITNGAGYITSADGGNAATLDSLDSTSFLRSDAADSASGDITFGGGAGAVTIGANSDIRLTNGDWTGESTKIQHHSNNLYIQGGSNGIYFRASGGSNRWIIDSSGHLDPAADNTYDLGASNMRVRYGYFGAIYGDGSNLTGISAGATGGGSDEIFYENGQTVTTNYTITNGKNAMAAGPITINSGVTVTVGSGETLTIV